MPQPKDILRAFGGTLVNRAYELRGLAATLIGPVQQLSPYSRTVLLDHPVRYYRLGEGIGAAVADYTGHGGTGTLVNSVVPVQGALPADSDGAMFFDGSTGYIDTPTMPNSPAFSLEAWGYTTSSATQAVLGQVDSAFNNATFYLRIGAGASGFATASGVYQETGSPTLSQYVWHHLVLVYDGSNLVYYVDGAVFSSNVITGIPQSLTNHTIIGRPGDFPGQYWNGALDEVAIYDYALRQDQVSTHLQAGLVKLQGCQPKKGPFAFGNLNTDPKRAVQEAGAGVNTAHIHVGWDVGEPTEGVFNGSYLYTISQQIQAFRAQGMQVCLGIELHYTP